MFQFTKEMIKADEKLTFIKNQILQHHEVPDFVQKALVENKHVVDYCVEACSFAILALKGKDLHVSYVTDNWIDGFTALVSCTSITVYDNLQEYEQDRISKLTLINGNDIIVN